MGRKDAQMFFYNPLLAWGIVQFLPKQKDWEGGRQ